MIYLLSTIFGSLAIIFIARIHNQVGAVVIGMDVAGIDFCLQWLRIKLTATKPKYFSFLVFGGLLVRVASIFVFLKICTFWFGFNTFNFYLFAICLLAMIPILSIVAAYKFKPQRD